MGPSMSPKHIILHGLGPSTSPNRTYVHGLVPSMPPNQMKLNGLMPSMSPNHVNLDGEKDLGDVPSASQLRHLLKPAGPTTIPNTQIHTEPPQKSSNTFRGWFWNGFGTVLDGFWGALRRTLVFGHSKQLVSAGWIGPEIGGGLWLSRSHLDPDFCRFPARSSLPKLIF